MHVEDEGDGIGGGVAEDSVGEADGGDGKVRVFGRFVGRHCVTGSRGSEGSRGVQELRERRKKRSERRWTLEQVGGETIMSRWERPYIGDEQQWEEMRGACP